MILLVENCVDLVIVKRQLMGEGRGMMHYMGHGRRYFRLDIGS